MSVRRGRFVRGWASVVDEPRRFADWILPGLHGLGLWDFDIAHTLTGQPVFSLARPVVTPPPILRHVYDATRAIASGLGGTIAAALPWESPHAGVRAAATELFKASRGATFGPAHEEEWARLLERRGWRAPFAARFEPFWYDITEGFNGVPVVDGAIAVPDRPGLGVELIPKEAKKYLSDGEANFFD